MGSVNTNFLPASSGLALGNPNQLWTAYLQDVFSTTVLSNSSNPALTGFLRLSSTDFVAWRNNANAADVTLSKTGAASSTTPADTLVFSGSGIEGPFISNQANPASAGQIRLADADVLNFRNHANGGDIAGLTHNTDDTITVGGTPGIKATIVAASASVSAPVVSTPTVNGAGIGSGLGLTTSNAVVVNSSSGAISAVTGTGNGSGNSGSLGLISGDAGATGNSGSILLDVGTAPGGTVGTIQTNTIVSKYKNISTAGLGIAPVYGATLQKTESAADTNVLTYTPPATAGSYRLRFVVSVSAAAAAVLGWTATWQDANGNAQSPTNLALSATGTAAPALTFTTSAASNYYGHIEIGVDNSATPIVLKFTLASGTVTARVTATVEQIA